jgi:LysM repeat protein
MKNRVFKILIINLLISFSILSAAEKIHVVDKGETVWRISKLYNVSMKEICDLNNIDDLSKVKAGMKLRIPSKDVSTEKKDSSETIKYKTHILKKGETIWQISKMYKIQPDRLCEINKITDITSLKPGLALKVPAGKDDKIIVADKESVASGNSKPGENFTYVLKKGETLYSVGRKYKVDVKELCALNGIDDITKVKTGMELKLPIKVEYLDYKVPLCGEIDIFKNSHFRGIHIFTEEDVSKRNVLAVEKGEITYIDTIPGFGLTVFVKNESGLLFTYSGFENVSVKKGDKISENTMLGIAGKLSRYDKYGILFSIQDKGYGLAFDMKKQKFIKS